MEYCKFYLLIFGSQFHLLISDFILYHSKMSGILCHNTLWSTNNSFYVVVDAVKVNNSWRGPWKPRTSGRTVASSADGTNQYNGKHKQKVSDTYLLMYIVLRLIAVSYTHLDVYKRQVYVLFQIQSDHSELNISWMNDFKLRSSSFFFFRYLSSSMLAAHMLVGSSSSFFMLLCFSFQLTIWCAVRIDYKLFHVV